MSRSLYFRNFMIMAALVLVSIMLIGLVFIFLARNFAISEKRNSLHANADVVEDIADFYGGEGILDDLDLRRLLNFSSGITGNHVLICDTRGIVVSCSDELIQCPHLGRQLDPSLLAAVEKSGSYDLLSDLGGVLDQLCYVSAVPLRYKDRGTSGYVFVSSSNTQTVEAWNAFMMIYLFVALIIMIIAMVVSFFASRYEAKPLKDMAVAARRFARGDFSVRVDIDDDREDEIGELTRAFNGMADALGKSESRRSEFIANISHELKTPMTSIAGFADGILDGTIPPEAQDRYLKTISSETKRLSRLVRSMLDMSRLDAKTPEELREMSFEINELLARTILNFEGKITERGLDVDVQLPEDSIMVRGDSDAITRVVYNLLDNAVKFAREGSAITLSLWKQGVKAYVSVKNEGETISPEELRLIFDRFHKADRSRSLDRDGVGLGLYLVKTILNNHNEDISVTSLGGTTEFVFTLTLV